jgi:ribosomal protein S18 acetylase RimI-like enzyme
MIAETAASDRALPPGISARPLTKANLEGAMALVAEARWNQNPADWQLFLGQGSPFCLTRDGTLIATAAILPYAPRFAWISMVLVTAAERRQGLARWLLRHCVEEIVSRGLVPVLDATPAGRDVYLGLGFRDTWTMQRLVGRGHQFAAETGCNVEIRRLREDDWPQIISLDQEAFGANREVLLRSLAVRLPEASFVAVRDGRIIGFSLGRDGRVMTQLGPVLAEDDDAAIRLVAAALFAISGPIALDVPDRHHALTKWLADRGFSIERPFTRMVHQRASSFDDTTRLFAIAGPELG